jgi:hypothetical protein
MIMAAMAFSISRSSLLTVFWSISFTIIKKRSRHEPRIVLNDVHAPIDGESIIRKTERSLQAAVVWGIVVKVEMILIRQFLLSDSIHNLDTSPGQTTHANHRVANPE